MTVAATSLEDLEIARARSAAYGLIAHGFRYPDSEWFLSLTDHSRWRSWPEHLPEVFGGASGHFAALRTVMDNLEPSSLELLQGQFASLFGHSVRGACPPYELEFGRSEIIQRSSDLADIGGFYAAFGVELAGEISERVDHISVESEFLALLCAKEALGLEIQDLDLVTTVHDAHRQFLQSHLGRWLPAFSRRVLNASPCDFYARLADFSSLFVTGECQRAGVSLGSPYLQLRPVDPIQEASQSCGVPGECGTSPEEQLTQLNVAVGNNGH